MTSRKPAAPVNKLLLDLPAEGDLSAHLEARIEAWRRKHKKPSDYVRCAASDLLEDALEMISRPEEDLLAFAAQEIAVTARHFDWIELHVRELERLGVRRRVEGARGDATRAEVKEAMARVLEARAALARRAEANGIPARLFALRHATTSPRALHRAALEVIDAATRTLPDFDSPRYARRLLDTLEEATQALGAVVGAGAAAAYDRRERTARRGAVLKSLHETLVGLAPWGRAMAAGDAETARRWRLGRVFRARRSRAKNAKEAPLVVEPEPV